MISTVTLLFLVLSSGANVSVTPGVSLTPGTGYVASNFDPTLTSAAVNQVYDPNFIPGFQVGLTNVSIVWGTQNGRADIGYSIGPWEHEEDGLPHMAVGPQCCNFKEIPRTQQFRRVEWGDYYFVRAGFGTPGVNIANYTTDFSQPAYVGLRTDWDWIIMLSLDWSNPTLLNPKNEWAAIGITTTQYVPSAPKKLVYTVLNFWMDSNSSSTIHMVPGPKYDHAVVGTNVVVYHLTQLASMGNQTITMNLSPYLNDTLETLGFARAGSQPPVISYVYLNVEGYNFRWRTALYSFFVMAASTNNAQNLYLVYSAAVIATVVVALYALKIRTPKRKVVARILLSLLEDE